MHQPIILQTKLRIPDIKGKVLLRERLLEHINRGLGRKLILLCADAGYGKTTLLSHLCSRSLKNYVYYGLDEADNDLTAFWSYLVSGMSERFPKFGNRVRNILLETRQNEVIVGTFINEFLNATQESCYIILDDFQHICANNEIASSLEYLLMRQPSNLHIIISSRVTPPFNLSYYLARQELWMIEKRDLQFNPVEIKSLLSGLYDLPIPEAELERVARHSEGWVTAIQLVLQRFILAGAEKAKETLNGYVTSGEELFNYFMREVFENQSPKMRDFLAATVVLKTLTPELCNRLLRIRNSGAQLKKMEREHLFVTRVGSDVYQYHPLFRDFIRAMAGDYLSEGRMRALILKAGSFFQTRHDWETALEYFTQAQDHGHAAQCLKKCADAMLRECRFNRLGYFLGQIPERVLNKDAELLQIKGQLLIHTMDSVRARSLYERLIALAREKQDRRILFNALYGGARLCANSNDFRQALRYLGQCAKIRSLPPQDNINLHNLKGVCRIHLGDFRGSEVSFQHAYQDALDHGLLAQNYSLLNNIAIMSFTKGELERSLRLFKQILKAKGNYLVEPHIYANIVLVLIDLCRLKEARESLVDAYRTSRSYTNQRGYQAFMLSLGFYMLELQDYDKAMRYFERLLAIASASGEVLTEHRAQYGLMKAMYYRGDYEKAERIAAKLLLKLGPSIGIRDHDLLLTSALIDIKTGRPDHAQETLFKALRLVEDSDFIYSLMRNYYHLALLYQSMKAPARALHYLKESWSLARSHGYDCYLVRMAQLDHGLLDMAGHNASLAAYYDRIIEKLMAQTRVDVRLLGTMEVKVYNKQVSQSEWETKKAQTLFIYMVMHKKRPVPKEELMARFSGQESRVQADQVIRTTVSRIQKALGLNRLLCYSHGMYRIHEMADISVDAEEFENVMRNFSKTERILDAREIAQVRDALQLYQGDFMPSWYDDWCEETRRYLRRLYICGLRHLGRYLDHHGDHRESSAYFEKILAIEPLDAAAIKDLVRSMQANGRISEAASHLKKFIDNYMQVMGEPPPKGITSILDKRIEI
jgi:LuxR family maltose regulon positive regulatory protein